MAIRKIVPSDKLAAFNKIKKLHPNMPANPVPDEKNPTHFDGNPFKNPRVVVSPKAHAEPCRIAATKLTQKKTSLSPGSKQHRAIKTKAKAIQKII